MVYAGILAGGVGSRMGMDIPKQFIMVKDKPVIIYTIEKFLSVQEVDQIIVAVLKEFVDYTRELISTYLDTDKVVVIEGGKSRSESLLNVCDYIGLDSPNILISHDACRPFVSERIIRDNISLLPSYDAVGTFIPLVDTLAVFEGDLLSDVPPRDKLFSVQTPQTFRVCDYIDCYRNLSFFDKLQITDASKVFLLNGKTVGKVEGDPSNIKITNPTDIEFANILIGRQKALKREYKNNNEEE